MLELIGNTNFWMPPPEGRSSFTLGYHATAIVVRPAESRHVTALERLQSTGGAGFFYCFAID